MVELKGYRCEEVQDEGYLIIKDEAKSKTVVYVSKYLKEVQGGGKYVYTIQRGEVDKEYGGIWYKEWESGKEPFVRLEVERGEIVGVELWYLPEVRELVRGLYADGIIFMQYGVEEYRQGGMELLHIEYSGGRREDKYINEREVREKLDKLVSGGDLLWLECKGWVAARVEREYMEREAKEKAVEMKKRGQKHRVYDKLEELGTLTVGVLDSMGLDYRVNCWALQVDIDSEQSIGVSLKSGEVVYPGSEFKYIKEV